MILSHRHRFVFIKGVKVAGTSVEIALSQVCGPEDIVTPITPVDEQLRLGTSGEPRNYAGDPAAEREYVRTVAEGTPAKLASIRAPSRPFFNHMAYKDVIELVPEAQEYQLLFVERSPYAKVISHANWRANQGAYMSGLPLPSNSESIRQAVHQAIETGTALNVRNIDRYRDVGGALRSAGWRIEHLAQSIEGFFTEIGERDIRLGRAKAGLRSDRLKFASVLAPEQIAFIDEAFAEEFETFGYPRATAP
jgi:hypothetical protein